MNHIFLWLYHQFCMPYFLIHNFSSQFFQTVLVRHLMPKESCNALIAAKLRKVDGCMQMVIAHFKSTTWMTGRMKRICMIKVTLKW